MFLSWRAIIAAEDRIEQLNAQRRRQKVAEHLREVERLLTYRRQLYEAMRVSCMGVMM